MKIVRKIYGPICDNLYPSINIVTDVKFRKLEFLGHLIRTGNNRIPKMVLDTKLNGRKKV